MTEMHRRAQKLSLEKNALEEMEQLEDLYLKRETRREGQRIERKRTKRRALRMTNVEDCRLDVGNGL